MFEGLLEGAATSGAGPWVLVALVVVGWWIRHVRSRRLPHPRAGGLIEVSGWRGRLLGYWRPLWRSLALLSLAVAVAFPDIQRESVERRAEAVAIMAVVDVSRSMRAEDIGPGTRMEAARRVLRSFVGRRDGDRVGLTAFGGRAMTVVPPTADLGLVRRSVAGLRAGMLGDGTAIGDALAASVARLSDTEAESAVVVLMTDGAANAGSVSVERAARAARGVGVRVHAIGVGRGGRVPVRLRRDDGSIRRIRARLEVDDRLLGRVAETTGGLYRRVTDREGLARVYGAIDRMERSPVRVVEASRRVSVRPWLVGLGLACLLVELAGTAGRARSLLGP